MDLLSQIDEPCGKERGFFEHRAREGFAENAKGYKEKNSQKQKSRPKAAFSLSNPKIT
jgi:hypothetical protein